MAPEELDTYQKALRVNLDPAIYGTIAEIGAGQEVAGWFFRVGAASGTVAKSMSAYDMQVSNEIYGESQRYVSRERLVAMLDHEFELILGRLGKSRGPDSAFFAFADTLTAQTYEGDNVCHGWLGIRFQSSPERDPSDIMLHVNMHDATNRSQQQAIGVLGVNLIYAAYNQRNALDVFLPALLDDLSVTRVEIDFIEVSGPDFRHADNRILGLQLLRHEMANAIMFTTEGGLREPYDLIYKRPIIIERGTFRSIQDFHARILDAAQDQLAQEERTWRRAPISIFEMTVNQSLVEEEPNDAALLDRVDRLLEFGHPVLISRYAEHYHLTQYLNQYTEEPIRFAMGISNLVRILQEQSYQHLRGGVLEALGYLLTANVTMYVYVMQVEDFKSHLEASAFDYSSWVLPESGTVTLENIRPTSRLRHLYLYLLEIGAIVSQGMENDAAL